MDGHTYSGRRRPYLTRKAWRLLSADPDRYTLHAHHKRKAVPHTIFILTLIATFALGWMLYDASTKAQLSSQWVEHTHRVLGVIGDTEDQLTRADAAMRAYAITGNSAFLMERDGALATLDERISELARLLADDAPQRSRIEILRSPRRQARRDHGRDGEAVRKRGPARRGRDCCARHSRRRRRSWMRRGSSSAWRGSQLEQRRQQESARHRRTTNLLAASALLALLVFVPMYVAFILQSRARARVERRLYDMADGVPGVVYQYRSWPDGSCRYEFLSGGVRELFGVDREAALADPTLIRSTMRRRRPGGDSRRAWRKRRKPSRRSNANSGVKLPEGGVKWVHGAAAPSKQNDGSIVWNGHWADVTEQKRLEQALQDAKIAADSANRAKSSFLAVMSHEISTPMNGVLGMLELLSLTELDRGAARDRERHPRVEQIAAADHRRHPRLLQDRGGQARNLRRAGIDQGGGGGDAQHLFREREQQRPAPRIDAWIRGSAPRTWSIRCGCGRC